MVVLNYDNWASFKRIINKAMITCKNSNISICNCFIIENKKIIGNGDKEKIIEDYRITRYGCFLIAQNGDVRKKEIALIQTYFALQSIKQEFIQRDLATNLFIITQTNETIKNKNIDTEDEAYTIRNKAEQTVKQSIKKIYDTMSEC